MNDHNVVEEFVNQLPPDLRSDVKRYSSEMHMSEALFINICLAMSIDQLEKITLEEYRRFCNKLKSKK